MIAQLPHTGQTVSNLACKKITNHLAQSISNPVSVPYMCVQSAVCMWRWRGERERGRERGGGGRERGGERERGKHNGNFHIQFS